MRGRSKDMLGSIIIIKLGFLKIVTKAASSSQTIKMQK